MKKHLLLIPALLGLFITGCSSDSPATESGASSNPSAGTSTTGQDSSAASASSSSSTSSIPLDSKATFNLARKQTVELNQYQYDFVVNAKIKYKNAVNFSPAQYSGTTWVDLSKNTSFMQERRISGALAIDSTNYVYNIGSDLIKISADEDKDFSVINHETIPDIKELDKNNFGYMLQKMADKDVANVNVANGKYEITFHTSFSEDSLLGLLNFIDSKTILKALSSYSKDAWKLTVNTWATLNADKSYLKTFHFDASVVIENTVEIGFDLEQTYTKYADVTITTPKFSNTITDETEVKSELNKAKTIFENSMNASTSYYDYKVKTTVDHGISKSNPLGLAVNSTTKGYSKRKLIGDKVYFNNRLLVDSDYENKDQLGDLVEDYDAYRARLNDGDDTVYDVLDPKVGFNKYYALDSYNEENVDNYYMMPSKGLLTFDSVKVIKKTQDKNSNNVYKFGLSTSAVKSILDHYNKSIRIDFSRKTIFDIYKIENDFVAKKALFKVTTNDSNKIISIELDLKGFYIEKDSGDQVKFRLEASIEYDWAKSYSAVTKKEDIDNNK